MILDDLTVEAGAFAEGTGWRIEPQGACRGDLCIPLPGENEAETVDVADVAPRLGMPLVHDPRHGLWALGPATVGGRALATTAAPDLELPLVQRDGVWRLADQRGRRTVIVAWAPW